jgi:acyl-CoA thioesterase
MAQFELDIDTALEQGAPGSYGGCLTSRWDVGGGMNGGYLATFCLRAVLAESRLPDPISMTLHYLSRPEPGPAQVKVEALRVGRGHASFRFDLVQIAGDGTESSRVAGIVLTGRLRESGPLDFAPLPPAVPGPDACHRVDQSSMAGRAVELWQRLELRVASAGDVHLHRSEPGEARGGGWTRLADRRPPDALCVPLYLDCWPPAVFARTMRPQLVGAPTLELTVHWRNRIRTGWHYAAFETRMLAGGYVDEEGELWGEDGTLVAASRQLARYSGEES